MNSGQSLIWVCSYASLIMGLRIHDDKAGIWCIVSWNWIIRPVLFDDAVNSECHSEVILRLLIGHLNLDKIICGCFEHCSTTAHTAHVSVTLLCSCVWEQNIFGAHLVATITRSCSIVVKCYKPESRGFDEFLNLPNPSGHSGPWSLFSL
jgi:hypothetical protein